MAAPSYNRVHIFQNNEAMSKHIPPSDGFPENPLRLIGIQDELERLDILKSCVSHKISVGTSRETFVELYGTDEVMRWETLVRIANPKPKVDPKCGDVYWSSGSLQAVSIAAKSAAMAVKTVLYAMDAEHSVEHAFAIVRPPGHHCFDVPAGFCIANNVVIAAKEALAAGKRVAIIDWDYHFGDGTAQAFLDEPNVMFCSLHCKKDSTGRATYPIHQLKGKMLATKTGGRMFNVQWELDDADNCAYAYAFEKLVIPAIRKFEADIILVSAGYDAIEGDALAGMKLTPHIFYELVLGLKEIGVPVVCVLEGGYDVELLGKGVSKTIQGLLDIKKSTLDALAEIAQRKHVKIVDAVLE